MLRFAMLLAALSAPLLAAAGWRLGAAACLAAALALALRAGAGLVEAAMIANVASGVVVGKVGTATASAREVREMLPQAIAAAQERI